MVGGLEVEGIDRSRYNSKRMPKIELGILEHQIPQ